MKSDKTKSDNESKIDILWTSLFIFTVCIWLRIANKISENGSDECLLQNNVYAQEIARPIFNCSICQSIKEFPVEYNITQTRFLQEYAYTRRPVVVKSAIDDWNATKVFSYKWFRDLYDEFEDSYDIQDEDGQFFPYKTEFESLEEALHMSKHRFKYPWYFGWNNVHSDIGKILRKHYQRPKFLPGNSETSVVDWIFMGTPGGGAHTHLDYVNRPSWQAQITGSKTWFLYPPPECTHVCHNVNITLQPGDILVVDTNQWYHGTKTHPGDHSITIGLITE